MSKITRSYLSQVICDKTGLSFNESGKIIDHIFESMINHFESNSRLKITGFGSFSLRAKEPRIARNPRTKEEAIVSARNVISFNPSRKLKARINAELSPDEKKNKVNGGPSSDKKAEK